MKITYDKNKRDITLELRGLDFEYSLEVFNGPTYKEEDRRRDYGEIRTICFGFIGNRMVVIGYVQRGDSRHIFSMRKANEKEQKLFGHRLEKN